MNKFRIQIKFYSAPNYCDYYFFPHLPDKVPFREL